MVATPSTRPRIIRFAAVVALALGLGCGGGNSGPQSTGGKGGAQTSSGGHEGGTAGSALPGGSAGTMAATGSGGTVSGSGGSMAGASGGGPAGRTGTGGAASGGSGGAGGGAGGGGAGTTGGRAGAGGAPVVDHDATLSIMRRVADYELARFASTPTDRNWARAVFYTGLMAFYGASGDAKYLNAAQAWGQRNNWAFGTDTNGRPLSPSDNSRFADNQTCVQTYAELYLQSPMPAMLAPATAAFDRMIAKPVSGRTEWWWCDALFMAPAALARTAKALNKPEYLALMHRLYWDTKAYLYSPAQHLFYRDDTFLASNTFWSRGNGWVFAGLARILEFVPADDPRRSDYEALLRDMADKLRTLQQPDGFWRSDLLNPNAYPTVESSGTAFYCFGLSWGINNGVLDRATFLEPAKRAWTALTTVVNTAGRLGWVQGVGSSPGPSTADNTNDYATGAFLLCGNEMLKL